MSNLIQRTLSGAVYVAILVATILLSQEFTTCLFAILAALAVNEYHKLMKSPVGVKAWAIVLSLVPLCFVMDVPPVAHAIAGLLLILALCAELFRKADNPMQNWGNLLISTGMIALPFALTHSILAMGEWALQRYFLLAIFVCIWSNDTGAYCIGSLIGKHKMFPRVSPGKSWEGLVGGFAVSLLAGYIFSLFVSDVALWQWLLIAFTVSLFGTFGDLMESLLKRTIGVKDSGKFMPGHGGVLDRFDSVLLCLPAVYLLLLLIL